MEIQLGMYDTPVENVRKSTYMALWVALAGSMLRLFYDLCYATLSVTTKSASLTLKQREP